MWPLSVVHVWSSWSGQTCSGQRSCDEAKTELRRPGRTSLGQSLEQPEKESLWKQYRLWSGRLACQSQNNVLVPRDKYRDITGTWGKKPGTRNGRKHLGRRVPGGGAGGVGNSQGRDCDSTRGLEQEWCCLGGEEALARQDKPSPAQTAVSQLNCLLISWL